MDEDDTMDDHGGENEEWGECASTGSSPVWRRSPALTEVLRPIWENEGLVRLFKGALGIHMGSPIVRPDKDFKNIHGARADNLTRGGLLIGAATPPWCASHIS
jgi:hypothetical protein